MLGSQSLPTKLEQLAAISKNTVFPKEILYLIYHQLDDFDHNIKLKLIKTACELACLFNYSLQTTVYLLIDVLDQKIGKKNARTTAITD